MSPPAGETVVFYDDTCRLCCGFVEFVRRRDRDGCLTFKPRDQAPAACNIDSVVLVERQGTEEEHTSRMSDAALRIFGHLGGGWRWVTVLLIVPRPLRDLVYRFIARHRHRLCH